jgi:tRNA-5-methyluridine54 2-sulfurtransferase
MKCRRCGERAVVALPSHNAGFCRECYFLFFSRQVEKAITSRQMFTQQERILVALSGGKDSLALMLELGLQGYDVTGLHIDLGIPDSSVMARGVVERFCSANEFPLIVVEMTEEGLPIPEVKEAVRRPICSVCGKVKRHYFNKIALEQGFTVQATGHNLDDEVSRLFANTLRWDVPYLGGQAPSLEGADGFARKVKPLYRLSEFETANYSFLKGIEYHYAPCPYSKGASFTVHKQLWSELEEKMPGQKYSFYKGFLDRGRDAFHEGEERKAAILAPCGDCGYPTSAVTCNVCRIRKLLRTEGGGEGVTSAKDHEQNAMSKEETHDSV